MGRVCRGGPVRASAASRLFVPFCGDGAGMAAASTGRFAAGWSGSGAPAVSGRAGTRPAAPGGRRPLRPGMRMPR
ncbi:hypothetical protein GCM10010286_21120 [Streptomyces toxytricini]|nr:hypothetical protein GCM10010286_21120 [Streptomyces toxytricini]